MIDGTVYVATTNAHKAGEIAAILAPTGLDVQPAPEMPDVVEDGLTFRDNAILKARGAAAALGVPCLADDSGLAVDVLDGQPGVHSARYAGDGATDLDNNALLIERLEALIGEGPIEEIRLRSSFLVRTAEPPLRDIIGMPITGYRRLGKRIILCFADDLFMVMHLMIAGRLRWRKRGAAIPGRIGLAAFDFEHGTLLLTEAGTKKRASLYVVRGEEELATHDRGGLEVLDAKLKDFKERLLSGDHTLKRALCDPRKFSGIDYDHDDTRLEPMPDIDAQREDYDIRSWSLEPGDAIAFHFMTIHGAPSNLSATLLN